MLIIFHRQCYVKVLMRWNLGGVVGGVRREHPFHARYSDIIENNKLLLLIWTTGNYHQLYFPALIYICRVIVGCSGTSSVSAYAFTSWTSEGVDLKGGYTPGACAPPPSPPTPPPLPSVHLIQWLHHCVTAYINRVYERRKQQCWGQYILFIDEVLAQLKNRFSEETKAAYIWFQIKFCTLNNKILRASFKIWRCTTMICPNTKVCMWSLRFGMTSGLGVWTMCPVPCYNYMLWPIKILHI